MDDVKEYTEVWKESIFENLKDHNNIMSKIYFDSEDTIIDKIISIIRLIKDCFNKEGKLIFIGNGGSCSQSEHIATEFVCINLPAISLTSNISTITALGNDFGYENVFSRQLESLANEKDILIVLSTSGNSMNILNAVNTATSKNIKVVGMTGESGGKLKSVLSKNDILIQIPSDSTQRIQEYHLIIMHIIFEIFRDEKDNK